MATYSRLNLTRDQLAAFLQDNEQIKQFERLFTLVDELQPTTLTDILVAAGNADQKAVEALDLITSLAQEAALAGASAEAKANQALSGLGTVAQDAEVNAAVADNKATQALDALSRIADSLELLAAAPVIRNDNSVVTDYVDHLTGAPVPAEKPGRVYWSDDDATLDLHLEGGVTYQFGQQLDFHPKNTSGVQINKGMAVMATGVVGSSTKITCARAVADGSVLPQYMLGIATQDIPNNSFGYVAWFGSVRGFNTTGASKTVPEVWVDGDILYFDPAYPGELTKVEPSAPALDLPIAIITNAANNGAIFVRMKTGETLNELHDVQFTLPLVNRDLLQYDSTAGYWKNITHFFLDATNKRMGINVPSPSTTLVINANTSTSPPTPLAGTVLDSHGANGSANRLAINAYAGAPAMTFVRSGGTMASPTAVVSGDAIGVLAGTGYNGSAYTVARASILYYAAETWTTTANGTEIRLVTTPLGSATPAERFKIGPAGQFGPVVAGVENYGLSGQVFTSGGASAQPSWQTPQGTPTLNVVTGTTQTAVANNHYVLTNVATSTLTLPATPTAGDVVWVTVGNGLTTNVVARNGSNIQSLAEDMTLNAAYAAVQMRYINSTIGWTFV